MKQRFEEKKTKKEKLTAKSSLGWMATLRMGALCPDKTRSELVSSVTSFSVKSLKQKIGLEIKPLTSRHLLLEKRLLLEEKLKAPRPILDRYS